MEFTEKTIVLKDGREALLRPARVDDAALMMDFLKAACGETPFLLSWPEECVMTLQEEEDFLRGIAESDEQLMLACFVEGRLAGNCQLTCNRREKTRHRAEVAIAIREAYWGLGIGTALLGELAAAARDFGAERLELEFLEGNVRARALYEKLGFRIAGVHPDAIRLRDGESRNQYLMIRRL